MLKTTQKFVYTYNGELKGYLMMPNEVEQVMTYLMNLPHKTLEDAFFNLTGFQGREEFISNVRLEVVYYSKPFEQIEGRI